MDDLIEIGAQAVNPVQVSARDMETDGLKREFGDRVAFWGAVDTQHTLPFGTVEDVRAEVRRRIQDLAPGGGYVLAAVHNIQPEVPPENICAMFEAARMATAQPTLPQVALGGGTVSEHLSGVSVLPDTTC